METIKSSKEIDLIFKNGKKINFPFLSVMLFDDKNSIINGDVAFIAGKKNGNAVWRNKSKRILREIYKQVNIWNNKKVLLIAKKNILEYKFEEIIKTINNEKNN